MRTIAVLVTLAGARVAHAEIPDEAGPVPDDSIRLYGGIQPSAGAVSVWNVGHGEAGAHVELGVQSGRFALVGEGEWFHLESACTQDGSCGAATGNGNEWRAGAALRWSVLQHKVVHGVHGHDLRWERLDTWVEAVAGEEWIAISDAKPVARPDVGLGLGLGLTNRAHGYSFTLHARFELAPQLQTMPVAVAMPAVATTTDGPGWSFVIGCLVGFGG
jgi:hypothetical protein